MHLSAPVQQLLFAAQLPVCVYVGQRTARRTGRSRLAWLVWSFLLAVLFPPLGAVAALVLFVRCPPARRPDPTSGDAAIGEHDAMGEPVTGDAPVAGEPSSDGTAA
jgi:hypothetical protein